MKLANRLPDPFIIGLIAMIITALVIPFEDSFATIFPLKKIIYWGITGIFFLYGLKLNPTKIKEDMQNWRLHVIVQSITFLIFPLLILLLYPLFVNTEFYTLWLATFFLAVLPSTVSSSVVMVSIARGNISSAIFNASISGLIGLFITPLWMSFFISSTTESMPLAEMTQQLLYQIVIPVLAGLTLNRYLGKLVQRNSNSIAWFDKIVIFLIIYKSFSAAFINGIFTQIPWWVFCILSSVIILVFFILFNLTKKIVKSLKFNRQDSITAVFCSSKKSLVHGSVFVTVIIIDTSLQSLFLLPIMIYHAFQLFYTSYLARKWSFEDQNQSI
jgi:solute carrier family 10 (sodium/bile acid cotransporter), member 7